MAGLSRRAVVAAGLAVVLAAGCAPGSDDGAADEPSPDTNGTGATDPSELGDVTLVVWDQEVRGGQDEQIEELNAAFQEQYPNITIDRVSRSFEDLQTTLQLALTGDDAPDVVQANNSRSGMGAFVEAGLLLPLDDYAAQYGWEERFPESVRAVASYSDDGRTFGEGNLYGLGQQGELVGVYYNKAKLEELGIDVPTTWEEFLEAVSTASEAGEVALPFGNLDQWPGIHVYGAVMNREVPTEEIRDLGYGREGADWTSAENAAAAEQIMQWVDAGYFTDGFNGTGYDPVWQDFGAGTGVFLIAGSWLLPDLDEALGDDLGFMLPPPRDGEEPIATGATSLPFAIVADSPNPDAAAAYVDFITNEDAMEVVAEKGLIPSVDVDAAAQSPAQEEMFEAWRTVSGEDGLVPYLDWATPTFYDTMAAALQEMLAGQITPEEYLQRLQDDYTAFVSG